jgi:hypothetical protein
MMKQTILFLLQVVLFIGFCWSITMADEKSKKVKVYYSYFDFDTFLPLTTDLIEKEADCIFEFDRTSDKAKRLTQIIDKLTGGLFDNEFVRLKVSGLFFHDFFVDQRGGVLRGNTGSLKLKPDAFIELKKLLDEWAEVKGCNF